MRLPPQGMQALLVGWTRSDVSRCVELLLSESTPRLRLRVSRVAQAAGIARQRDTTRRVDQTKSTADGASGGGRRDAVLMSVHLCVARVHPVVLLVDESPGSIGSLLLCLALTSQRDLRLAGRGRHSGGRWPRQTTRTDVWISFLLVPSVGHVDRGGPLIPSTRCTSLAVAESEADCRLLPRGTLERLALPAVTAEADRYRRAGRSSRLVGTFGVGGCVAALALAFGLIEKQSPDWQRGPTSDTSSQRQAREGWME